MEKLDEIKHCIGPELDELQKLMEHTLRTRVPLADSVIGYFRDRKGKGVRPILTLLSAKLLTGEATRCTYDGAVALELLHNASLMHDDVIDGSDRRRGAATINRIWDNKVAVLMGDFFLSKCLLRLHATRSFEILAILSDIVTRLSEGELEQLSNMRARSVSEEAYFRVIGDKTASLFSACMKIGAISVGASADEAEQLALIGEKIGLVFQVRDDLFDYLPSAEMGKPSGNDIREGKITLPLLYALRHAPAAECERMKRLLEENETLSAPQIAQLVDFAVASGGIEYAQATMKSMAFEAKSMLAAFPDSPVRRALMDLVDYFMARSR